VHQLPAHCFLCPRLFNHAPPRPSTRYDHNATTSHRRPQQSFQPTTSTAASFHSTYIVMGLRPLFQIKSLVPDTRLTSQQLPFQHTALLLGTRLHLLSSLLLHRPLDAMGGGVISRTGLLPLWGLPCTSEFFCWPLRRRMRSQYTPIYYRKSPVPSIELSTNRCSLYLQLRLSPSFVPPLIAASHILLFNSPRSPCDIPHGS